MRRIFVLSVFLIICAIFPSCINERHHDGTMNYIRNIDNALEKSSNKNILELSSNCYSEGQLAEIIQFNGTIGEYNDNFPIDCIRRDFYGFRVAYYGNIGIAIVRFNDLGEKLTGEIVSTKKCKNDFSQLSYGDELQIVRTIDPEGQYLFLETGRNDYPKVSTHYTSDGYLITIEYDELHLITNITEELI